MLIEPGTSGWRIYHLAPRIAPSNRGQGSLRSLRSGQEPRLVPVVLRTRIGSTCASRPRTSAGDGSGGRVGAVGIPRRRGRQPSPGLKIVRPSARKSMEPSPTQGPENDLAAFPTVRAVPVPGSPETRLWGGIWAAPARISGPSDSATIGSPSTGRYARAYVAAAFAKVGYQPG